ncbi:MAG: hypothetical protein ACOY46_02880 [Bacillota bacterium]
MDLEGALSGGLHAKAASENGKKQGKAFLVFIRWTEKSQIETWNMENL